MQSRTNSDMSPLIGRARQHAHPRPIIWRLLSPIIKDLLTPAYIEGLQIFQADDFQTTFQFWGIQILQDAIGILFQRNRVLLWNLSTLVREDEYDNFCCYDCEIFSTAIRAFYGILLKKPSTLGMIFVDDPENGDSASMEVLVKFMRGTIEQLKDDEDPREFSCKDAQEFWKNFRAAVKVAGEI